MSAVFNVTGVCQQQLEELIQDGSVYGVPDDFLKMRRSFQDEEQGNGRCEPKTNRTLYSLRSALRIR